MAASEEADVHNSVLVQLEQAEAFKNEGNILFKEQNYQKALGKYWKVFCYVNGLQIPGEANQSMDWASMVQAGRSSGSQVPADRVESVKKLKQSTYLNMAACYLKIQEWRKCVDACTKALAADGPISKAYFRRGQAQSELGNLDESKEDFLEAQNLGAVVELELQKLQRKFKQHDAKEKKKYAKMFSDLKDEPEDARMVAAPVVASEAPVATEEAAAPPTEQPAPNS